MAGNFQFPMAALVTALLLAGCETSERLPAYHAPLTSVGARFGALPSAVQNSIRAQTGSAEIQDIEKEQRSVGVLYKVTYVNQELYPPLFVGVDGSVINPDMSVAVGAPRDEAFVLRGGAAGGLLHFSDLPAPVAQVVDDHGARSEVTSIDRQNWGSRVVYTIAFKDPVKMPTLFVAADGTILRDVHR
jgi:hypothetical protein